jgi:hypothetical protein
MYRWNPFNPSHVAVTYWTSFYGYQSSMVCATPTIKCHSWIKQQLCSKWQDCWTHHKHGKPQICWVWSILVLSRTLVFSLNIESVLCFTSSPGLSWIFIAFKKTFNRNPALINPSVWSDEHCSSCCTLSFVRLYLDNIGRKFNWAALYVFMKELALLWCGRQFLQIIASFFSLLSKFGFSFCSP